MVTLPQSIRNNGTPYIPYIFTEDEIIRFFETCDNILPYPGSQKHIIIPVIFRLLYGCGLRVSEVTNLKCSDIDLDNGVIIIRDSKFGNDRLVPLSNSLLKIMQRYSIQMNHSCKKADFFFRSKNLNPISRHWIYNRFRGILWSSKISHMGKGKGPRLHDLRHSFCVRSLKKMVDRGTDIYCSLPLLSKYVGHTSVKATQGYVRLTVDIHSELIEKISAQCAYVIPEVHSYESN
jgi:integrase